MCFQHILIQRNGPISLRPPKGLSTSTNSVLLIFILHYYFSFSKQAFLQDVPNPHELPDGTPSFVDFMGTRNNRFTTPDAAQKNRVQPPAKVLHFFNAPPNISEESISNVSLDISRFFKANFKDLFPVTHRGNTKNSFCKKCVF